MGCGEKEGQCGTAGKQVADNKLKMFTEDETLIRRLSGIRHKILVLSGKGGVGKSTVAVNLAVALAMEGWKTGILDVDFHGPSVPMLLNMKGELLKAGDGDGILPLESPYGVKVISLGFALGDADEAVIWRGPMKMGVIKQLLADVQWGELDYLVVDFPPGTGDEPLSVAQLIPDSDGAVIVTTPQDLSLQDVRKSINFCHQLKIPVLGVLENMSGLGLPALRDGDRGLQERRRGGHGQADGRPLPRPDSDGPADRRDVRRREALCLSREAGKIRRGLYPSDPARFAVTGGKGTPPARECAGSRVLRKKSKIDIKKIILYVLALVVFDLLPNYSGHGPAHNQGTDRPDPLLRCLPCGQRGVLDKGGADQRRLKANEQLIYTPKPIEK